MSTFKIIKKGTNDFWHWFNNDAKKVAISSFAVVLEEVSQTFSIVYINGANVPQQAVNVLDIEVIDETDTSDVETFTNVIDLRARLVELGYTAYLIGGGIDNITGLIAEGTNVTITGDGTLASPYVINASGAVDSVNGQTGVVVLDANDVGAEPTITSGTTSQYYRGDKTFKTLDKSAVGLSNVVNSDTTTTANITDSTNKRFVTDANLTTIGNTSGTNSGDNATNTTSNAYADAKVEDVIVNGVTTKAPSQNAVFDALALKIDTDSTFPMRLQFAASSPLDSTTYYTGGSNNLILSTTNNRFVYAGITATKFRVSIFVYSTGTLGTSENVTFTLMNVTQGTTIDLTTTAKFNSASYGFVGLFNFNVTEGDSLALRIVTPNFATNPTAVVGGANLILIK